MLSKMCFWSEGYFLPSEKNECAVQEYFASGIRLDSRDFISSAEIAGTLRFSSPIFRLNIGIPAGRDVDTMCDLSHALIVEGIRDSNCRAVCFVDHQHPNI